jgi:septal ring factor EnvC (AmiA/AmiB activator)
MYRAFIVAFIVAMFVVSPATGIAQESNMEQLKLQIELLEAKLQLAEQEAERLEKECEDLRKENARLKGDTKVVIANKDDAFKPGVVWIGEAINNEKGKTRWALSVSERKGHNFAGAIAAINSDGKKVEFSVTGKAPEHGEGLVQFESPLLGRAKMFMRGTLRNGAIALAFSGTTPLGKKIFGSATLRPKQ